MLRILYVHVFVLFMWFPLGFTESEASKNVDLFAAVIHKEIFVIVY